MTLNNCVIYGKDLLRFLLSPNVKVYLCIVWRKLIKEKLKNTCKIYYKKSFHLLTPPKKTEKKITGP